MIIGLMGGIGCGKSTVLNYLEQTYNAYIIEADKVAKEIMNPGNAVYNKIADNFSEAIRDGNIDRNILADIVFHDKEKLTLLNAITHPGTIDEIKSRIRQADDNMIVIESAILPGSGLEEYCDELWFVYCELEERIRRLMKYRSYSREKCLEIIKNQPGDEEYNTYADEYIDNTYSENNTKEQIDIILQKANC